MTSLRKNIFREVRKTKSRFFSIAAIVALSVGFFSGLKAASPSMVQTAEDYFISNNLMDIRLVSTVGFDDDDIEAIKNSDNVESVMAGYFSDLMIEAGDTNKTVRVYSVPEMDDGSDPINSLTVVEGRLPQSSGECVVENSSINSQDYEIGDIITFSDEISGTSTDTYIKNQEYTVVGIVESPLYLNLYRESTNVGSGSISFYMLILSEDFVTERYTNVYVKTTASSSGVSSYSDEYEIMIEENVAMFEELGAERVEIFESTVLDDAKQELSDAQEEYDDKKQEAEELIADGTKELNEAQEEFNKAIFEAQQEIEENEALLEAAKEELAEAKELYQTGLDEALEQITEAQTQYTEGLLAYNEAVSEFDQQISEAQALIDESQKEYDNAYNLFYLVTKPQAEQKLEILNTLISVAEATIDSLSEQIEELKDGSLSDSDVMTQLEQLQTELDEAMQTIEEYQEQYEEAMQQIEEGEEQLADAKEQLDAAQAELDAQKSAVQAELDAAKAELDEAESQLSLAKLQYETEMNKGALQLSEAEDEIEEGEEALEEGKAELEEQYAEGMKQLKEARETLNASKQEAYTQLEEAAQQLADAQEELDSLDDAEWYVYTRDDNMGYASLTEDAERVDAIAAIFPVFFLVVAVLVCLTTLSRMVEERRTEIGTLKALGYSNGAIISKYFVYSASAAILGSIIGLILGLATLPYIVVYAYGMLYTLPSTVLSIPWGSVIASVVLALICTCGVAVYTCRSELKRNAAELMRPKAPKPGKRILLERIKPVWARLNFTTKFTARNLFRYKTRFLMTVIGVAGCTALIVAGFGLKDSISVVADRQFEEISTYDAVFAISVDTESEQKYLLSEFNKDQSFDTVLLSYQSDTVIYGESKNLSATLIAVEDLDSFTEVYCLRDRSTGQEISLSDDGVVITERAGDIFNLSVGDTIKLSIDGKKVEAKVSGITENYANNYVYMTTEYYEQLSGKDLEYNAIITSFSDEYDIEEEDIAEKWMEYDEIVTVVFISDTVASVNDMFDSLNLIVFVIILCAGLLAIVVLYNLTNINISERVREIATIKVLGFYNGETAMFVYRENIILTLVGAFVGLLLGVWLNSFIISNIQMDNILFPTEIAPISFVFGILITCVFSLLVNFIMYFKMNKISMVESLKSIE